MKQSGYSIVVHDRFLNFHGQYGARLNRSQSIHGAQKRQRTWLIKFLSPMLFAAPNTHLDAIEELWVDRLTLKRRCEEFFIKLNTQWGEHIVHVCVLVARSPLFVFVFKAPMFCTTRRLYFSTRTWLSWPSHLTILPATARPSWLPDILHRLRVTYLWLLAFPACLLGLFWYDNIKQRSALLLRNLYMLY